MSGIFITGTDTGVGKTFVGCGLVAALRARGKSVGVMKPAETGCEERDGRLHADDASRLLRFSGADLSPELVCPYRFAEPLAPAAAARRAGVRIEKAKIIECYRRIAPRHDVTVVEGAGGLMVPLADGYTFADLARDLALPLLVVVGSKLGAINHTLLTLHCAKSLGLPLLGYVLNQTAREPDLATRTNGEVLSRHTDTPCLGSLPFWDHRAAGNEREEVAAMAAFFAGAVDLAPLAG